MCIYFGRRKHVHLVHKYIYIYIFCPAAPLLPLRARSSYINPLFNTPLSAAAAAAAYSRADGRERRERAVVPSHKLQLRRASSRICRRHKSKHALPPNPFYNTLDHLQMCVCIYIYVCIPSVCKMGKSHARFELFNEDAPRERQCI